MDEHLTALLDELHDYGVEHDADKPNRLDRLRNLEPDTARLLALLVRATRARAVLELGTSNGYSTLWLADSARAVGGYLVSVEVDADRSSQAARNLDRAGLRPVVELRVQDAADALKESPDAAWDMIFLDAERPAYPGYWPDLVRTLKPGGLLAVDNVLSHADQVRDFRALVSADPRVTEALAPTGAGALLVVREEALAGLRWHGWAGDGRAAGHECPAHCRSDRWSGGPVQYGGEGPGERGLGQQAQGGVAQADCCWGCPLGGRADAVRALRDHLGAGPTVAVVGVQSFAAGEGLGEHDRVFECLAGALAEVWGHGMRSVTGQRDLSRNVGAERREFVAVPFSAQVPCSCERVPASR